MLIAAIFVLILFLVPDLCIYGMFLRNAPLVWRILFFVPSALGLLSIVGMRIYGMTNGLSTLFLVVLLCLTVEWLIRKRGGLA